MSHATNRRTPSQFDLLLLITGCVGALVAAGAFIVGGRHALDTRDIALLVAVTSVALVAVPRWGLRALMVVPLLLGPLWLGDPQPATGDEPHYLVIADSLVDDGDLAIRDDYETPAFSSLEPTHLGWDRRTGQPSEYSVHQPGIGVLAAPGWALADRRGALAVIAFATALLLREMVLLAEGFGVNRRQAVLATGLVYLAPAVLLYGRVVYTEIVVALALTHLGRVLRRCGRSPGLGGAGPGLLLTASLACAAVPWLHMRYILPAGVLAAALAFRARSLLRWAPALALVASGVSVVVIFQRWFGAALPSAAYGPGYDHLGAPSLRSVVGILVDGHVGLVFAAPIVLVGLAAAPLVARRDRFWTAAIGAATLAYFVLAAGWSGWWLGTSTPGRNWTPLAPLAVPFVAALAQHVGRRATAAVLAIAIAFAGVFIAFPRSAYPGGPGGSTTVWARARLDGLSPTFRPGFGTTSLAVGVMLVAVTAVAVLLGSCRLGSRAAAGPD